MAFTLATAITAIRNRHPAFDDSRVPDPLFAAWASDYQNELIGKAVARDKGFLSQSIAIALDLNAANDPTTAGAGTTGGTPSEPVSGSFLPAALTPNQEEAGVLVEPLLTAAAGGTVQMAERAVTSATATTTTSTGAGRTINADTPFILVITRGKGKGQYRKPTSNTATVWTHAAWTTIPDTTSRIILVSEILAASTIGGLTKVPSETPRTGYLVRLDAAGVAYIDYTQPLTVWVDRGVALPSHTAVTGGTVRYRNEVSEHLCITSYARRFDPPTFPAVYLVGTTLYLCGSSADWQDIESLELRYIPIAPAFTAPTDTFLLPDAARPCVVAYLAFEAGSRCESLGAKVDVQLLAGKATKSELDYLSTLRLSKRARITTFREGDY